MATARRPPNPTFGRFCLSVTNSYLGGETRHAWEYFFLVNSGSRRNADNVSGFKTGNKDPVLLDSQSGLLASESVTGLLMRWSEGDHDALEKLTPLVYDELHRLAASYLRSQRPDHTLQATALVHEAYLRLLDINEIEWQSRAHFICLMAQLMRHVLVDHARSHAAQKRGGDAFKMSLSRADNAAAQSDWNLVELNEVLDRFAARFPRQGKAIELHFFGGLRVEEIPAVLSGNGEQVSTRTVERDLKFARAWLRKEIENPQTT